MSIPITQHKNPFQEKMEALDDKKLLKTIENGGDYQPQAFEAAVKVAIERNLLTQQQGETILEYTIKTIETTETQNQKKATRIKDEGKVQIVVGICLFSAGIWLLSKTEGYNYHYYIAVFTGLGFLVRGIFNRL